MELNKKKYREHLLNVLNFAFNTNSFVVNTNKKTNKQFPLISIELSTVVNINFNIDNFELNELVDDMVNTVMDVESEKNVSSIIFISYTDFDGVLDNFYQFVDDKSTLEVDVWDMEILNTYFEQFEKEIQQENFVPEKFDYKLNYFPEISINPSLFEKSLKNIDNEFFKKKKQVCVLYNEMIASGKTSAVVEYANSRTEKFNHVAFIKLNNDLRIDFIKSFENSNLGFKYNFRVNIYQNYYELLTVLSLFSENEKSKKENLLIFDEITNIKEIAIVNEIAKATGFKVLLTSLSKSLDYVSVGLTIPSLSQISDIFTSYVPNAKPEIIEAIFEPIDNNLFFAHFLGKQIKNNPQIKFNSIAKNILAKEKKVYRFDAYLLSNISDSTRSKHIILLKFIMAVYEAQVKDFSSYQKLIFKLLSTLPQINFTFEDLINYLKISEKNTDTFVNEFIELQKRGWIETSKNNISQTLAIKKILHKKLKPNATNLKNTLKYLTTLIYKGDNLGFKNVIIAENIIHNLLSVNDSSVDLVEVISYFYANNGYFESSEYFSELAAEFFEKVIEYKEPSIDDYNKLIRFNILAKNFEKALYYNQLSYEFSVEKYGDDSEQTANAALNMAIIHENMHDYNNAITHIETALDIYEQYYDQSEEPLAIAMEIHDQISAKIEEQDNFTSFSKFMVDFFDNTDDEK